MEILFGYGASHLQLAQLKELLAHKVLLILAGPNAAGKGTIADLLLKDPSLRMNKVRLHTSRPVRLGETRDEDYFFISQETYENMQKDGEFLQWQRFPLSGCYGISTRVLLQTVERSKCVLIDTGIGATLGLKTLLEEHTIPYLDSFISPVPLGTLDSPKGIDAALSILRKRMLQRNRGESKSDMESRLDTAKMWLRQASRLPFHFVVNTDGKHEEAYHHILAMIRDHLCRCP